MSQQNKQIPDKVIYKNIDWIALLTAALEKYQETPNIRTNANKLFQGFFTVFNNTHTHKPLCEIILNFCKNDNSPNKSANAMLIYFALTEYMLLHRNSKALASILIDNFINFTAGQTRLVYLTSLLQISKDDKKAQKSTIQDELDTIREEQVKIFNQRATAYNTSKFSADVKLLEKMQHQEFRRDIEPLIEDFREIQQPASQTMTKNTGVYTPGANPAG